MFKTWAKADGVELALQQASSSNLYRSEMVNRFHGRTWTLQEPHGALQQMQWLPTGQRAFTFERYTD
jgi:hypothetical protein